MEKQKKSVGTIALVVLLLLVTIASLIVATFAWARYTTTLPNGSASVEVAKWNVKAAENGATFSKEYTHVVTDKMAPGTSGSMTAGIDVTGTEVDVEYKVIIMSVTNKPTNLKFYSDAEFKNEVTLPATIPATGTQVGDTHLIKIGDASKTGTATIYWKWDYQTGTPDANGVAEGDAADTTDGQNAKPMTVTYRIDAWQVQPEPHE